MATVCGATITNYAVGIDLGTTNSVVAVYKDGEVHVVVDELGHNVTPSVVAFTNLTQLVGWPALKQQPENPDNTVYEIKRLMGRKYLEPCVQANIEHWPFTVTEKGGEPRLKVEYRSEVRHYRPEQVSAMLLMKLRQMACEFLGFPPFTALDAVITVPVYFDDSQKVATKEACDIAGLTATCIISEPAAAAVAYGLQRTKADTLGGNKYVLVTDIGGGTSDVTLLKMTHDSQFDIIAKTGDNNLGGVDIDSVVVTHCLQKLEDEHQVDIKDNHSALIRLHRAVEKAKCILSSGTRARIELDEIVAGVSFLYIMTRSTLEELINDLLGRVVSLVEKCLKKTSIGKENIDVLVLAGGTSKIPRLQALLSGLLPNVEIHKTINQEVAVAYGAAIQAAKDKGILQEKFLLSEVIPFSLGIELFDGTINRVLERHTPIPAENSAVYHTLDDYQTSLIFNVYEGEGTKSKDNKKLGSMTLSNIREAPACEVGADTTFTVDVYGILQLCAKEQGTDNEISVVIDRYKKHLSWSEVKELGQKTVGDNIHGLVHNLCEQMSELTTQVTMDERDKEAITLEAARAKEWMEANPNPLAEEYGIMLQNIRSNVSSNITISNVGRVTYQHKDK